MNALVLTIAIVITHLLLFIPLGAIITKEKMNNDILFIYLSNVILTIAFLFFFISIYHLMFSFYISFFQMIFSYLLIFNIKNNLKKYNLLSIPHFILWVYIFSNVLILYLF